MEYSQDDPSSVDATLTPMRIYAIRRGKDVTNGVFLQYEDCKHMIEGIADAEYRVFENMNDALVYLNPIASSTDRPPTDYYVPNDVVSPDANANVNVPAVKAEATHTEPAAMTFAAGQLATTPTTTSTSTSTSTSAKKPSRISAGSSFSKHARKRTKADNNPNRRPTKAWEKMFEKFKNHVKERGTHNVTSIDDPVLHKWTKQQEIEYKNLLNGKGSSMFEAKINKLQEVGFKFNYISIQDRYAMLFKFKEEHGHYNVPPSNELYKWIEKQRVAAKKFSRGDDAPYFDMRLKELMALGVHSSPEQDPVQMDATDELAYEHDQNWDVYFNQILRFKQENGHCHIPKSANKDLHAWVQRQHLEYQKIADGKPNHHTLERIQKLTDIGFVFEKRKQSVKWEERIMQLKRYKEKHGHMRVPKSNAELGVFVNRQRYEYTKMLSGKPSSLNKERLNELRAIDFVFQAGKKPKSTPKRTWEERFQELMEYKGEKTFCLDYNLHRIELI